MQINRFKGKAKGRNRCVEHGGIIYAVATAEGKNIQEQTLRSLKYLDESLKMAGSDKTRILQGQIFLADMNQKADMDVVWNELIGADWHNWPQRACVGAPLTSGTLVEIVLTAAKA